MRGLFTPDAAWRIEEMPAEVAEDIEIEDVRALLQQQLVPSNLEVAISGDFEVEELEVTCRVRAGMEKKRWLILTFTQMLCRQPS